MRRFTPYCCVLAAALAAMPFDGMAQGARRQIVKPSEKTVTVNGHQLPLFGKLTSRAAQHASAVALQKAPRKTWGGAVCADEIINEGFDKFTKGSAEEPDTEALCDEYGYYGGPVQTDIDPQYTEAPGWNGNWVFQAGGNAYLKDTLGYEGAMLNSALGDYSGDLTITVRMKCFGKKKAYVNVNMLCGGYNNPNFVDTGSDELSNVSTTLYPENGWKIVTLKVHNLTSSNDGFLQILSYGECLIDYVRVDRNDNFMAEPAMLPITNFTDGSFTANWQKMAMAQNYYTWIYQRDVYGTEDRLWTADFEDGIAEGFTTNGKIADGIGADDTKALTLAQGDTLTTPYNFSTYKNMTFWMKVAGATEDELIDADASIDIDLLTDEGWKSYGSFYADGWVEPGEVDMEEATKNAFSGRYYGVRIYGSYLPKNSYIVLDNMNVQGGKDADLLPLSIEEEYGYRYDDTEETSYTFSKNILPIYDYYYGVQSHYGDATSALTLRLAYGVATPKVKPATDIDSRGSYTANWEKSYKATSYTVTNYGVYTAAKDEVYNVVDEDFSGVNEKVTQNTDPTNPDPIGANKYQSLDKYTKNPGWTVKNMALSQGWMGAVNDNSTYGAIKTPALYLDNDEEFNLKIKAVGTPGDELEITTPNETYTIPFNVKGVIDGTYTVPEHGKAVVLRFTASNTFMVDNIQISQNVKAGSNVYTWLSAVNTENADVLSAAFDGLDAYSYDKYAYSVTALRTDSISHSATSDPSDYVTVNLANGSSVVTAIDQPSAFVNAADVAERYNLSGQRINGAQRGINIVRMKNGTVRKVLVK